MTVWGWPRVTRESACYDATRMTYAMKRRQWRRRGASAVLGALLMTTAGCYLSDDEGGRTRRQMDEEFHSSTGSEWSEPRGACADAADPACGADAEAVRCGAGYPACPDGRRCVDDPERACRTASDPTCPGVCD